MHIFLLDPFRDRAAQSNIAEKKKKKEVCNSKL